jgi:hypothetical protein
MAIQVRKTSPGVVYALVAELNAMRRLMASTMGVVHGDVTSSTNGDFRALVSKPATFAAPAATDLPSLLALCGELAGRHFVHLGDELAHETADGANALAHSPPTTLADAQAFLTDAKAKWNAHLHQAGVHFTSDTANAITAPDATDLPSAIALANAYRAAFAAHIQNALFGASIQLLEA